MIINGDVQKGKVKKLSYAEQFNENCFEQNQLNHLFPSNCLNPDEEIAKKAALEGYDRVESHWHMQRVSKLAFENRINESLEMQASREANNPSSKASILFEGISDNGSMSFDEFKLLMKHNEKAEELFKSSDSHFILNENEKPDNRLTKLEFAYALEQLKNNQK